MGYFITGEMVQAACSYPGRLTEGYMYKAVHVNTPNGHTQHVAVIQDDGEYHSFLGAAFRKG